MVRTEERLIHKPAWVDPLEERLGLAVPFHPNLLSAAKLFAVFPAMAFALTRADVNGRGWAVVSLYAIYIALDYLDGVVARASDRETTFGRTWDRATDLPMLLLLGAACMPVLPQEPVALKFGLDLLVLVLFAMGRGSTENRLRTVLTHATLFSLLMLGQGWGGRVVSVPMVQALLYVQIGFTAMVAGWQLGLLRKRRIADALSAANLACGLLSMYFATLGRLEISLMMLLLGAVFDGLDGAAARRFGGSRFGVYADDLADGVNYGLAPGFAMAVSLPGAESWILGALFALFVLGRLVFFTLGKGVDDPAHFRGAPSTIGGAAVLASLALFSDRPLVVGAVAGVVAAQMVAFDLRYRHLGRAMHREVLLIILPLLFALLLGGSAAFGARFAIAVVLAASLAYGFAPTLSAWRERLERHRAWLHP